MSPRKYGIFFQVSDHKNQNIGYAKNDERIFI